MSFAHRLLAIRLKHEKLVAQQRVRLDDPEDKEELSFSPVLGRSSALEREVALTQLIVEVDGIPGAVVVDLIVGVLDFDCSVCSA